MSSRVKSLVRGVKSPGGVKCPGVTKSGVNKMARSDAAMSQDHTHKFQKKCILIIMPMYKRERVGVLLTVSSHLKRQVHKSI